MTPYITFPFDNEMYGVIPHTTTFFEMERAG
jgi:hypothetical protein